MQISFPQYQRNISNTQIHILQLSFKTLRVEQSNFCCIGNQLYRDKIPFMEMKREEVFSGMNIF